MKPRLHRPSPRLVALLAAVAVPAAAATWSPALLRLAVGLDALTLLLILADLALTAREEAPIVEAVVPERVSRSQPFTWVWRSRNPSDRAVDVNLSLHLPPAFEPSRRVTSIRVEPGSVAERSQTAVARSRGSYSLQAPIAEVSTPLGLGVGRVTVRAPEAIAVLPDTHLIGRFDALARQRRLHEMGVSRSRPRGEGTEIAGLRPYALGDPFSRIDWKATARRATTVARELHAERRQTVVMLLDCGRRMARESHGRSRLDHAVEAALLLAHVALRSDDRVGLVAFSDRTLKAVSPVRGLGSAPAIARALFDLDAALVEPPYERVAAQVSLLYRKRSLLVLFTDALEPTSLDALAKPLRFLSQRHLVLCVVFRDAAMEEAVRRSPESPSEMFRLGAATEVALEREKGLQQLRRAGAMVLETPPDALSTQVINTYLKVKARHLL